MSKTNKYLSPLLNIAIGIGAVVGGAYIFSRIKEKQDAETRLERMEQMLEEIAAKGEGSKGAQNL